MNEKQSAGRRFRSAMEAEKPLQLVGVINAYAALMAEEVGFNALYLSGAGVANYSYGLPDLGLTSREDVLIDVHRITSATPLPLLVDVDTGWGDAADIARTVTKMMKAGAASIHIEDQIEAKRCGHRPGKSIVSKQEMIDRIKAAVDARTDPDFVIMARSDALAIEGLESMIERVQAYIEAGADMFFAEAMGSLDQYQQVTRAISVPVLANMTEFGKTPLFTVEELASVGVQLVLYPLSAVRAMNAAALAVYRTIREKGTQRDMVNTMQTREELYEFLDYYRHEENR